MSTDPFGWPNQRGAPPAGLGASGAAFQATFSPLAAGLQPSPPAPSGGWVSFEDDSGNGGFGASLLSPPTSAAPAITGATSWAPQFDDAAQAAWPSPSAAPATAPASAAAHVFTEPLRRPPVRATAPTAAPPSSIPAPSSTSGSANAFLPLAPAVTSSFPLAAPSTGLEGGSGSANAPTTGSSVDPSGSSVHRLPRPPTSVTRGAPGPGAVTSLGSQGVTVAVAIPASAGSAGNAFTAGLSPPGGTAVARSLDPFADLSLRPALPRPPPMLSGKSPAAVAGGLVVAPGPSLVSPPPTAGAAMPAQQPATAPSSVFPTFAALHQQAAAAAPPRNLPHAPTTPVAAPLASPLLASVAAASPVAPASAPGTWWDRNTGVIETTSFDAFYSPLKAAQAQHQAGDAATATAVAAAPPPPYIAALDMPSPSSSPLALLVSPQLPAPPPYTEALGMPEAQPTSPGPPPSYEEAVALPAAGVAGPVVQPPDELPSWATFDEGQGTWGRSLSPTTQPAPGSQQPAPKSLHAPLPEQICVEVRLPPLKPKEAAAPKRLVAGMGLVFAAPGGDGVAALQWWLNPGHGMAEGGSYAGPRFAVPAGAATQRVAEDQDSAPAAAVPLAPHVADLSSACCMLLDDVSGGLWTGHKDGKIVRWSVEPGRAAVYEHHWRAHLRGKVTTLIMSPWGEVWSASSGGSIRAWQYAPGSPGTRPPIKLFECRRSRLTLGAATRAAAQRAHSKARLMAVGPSGRVVWSVGRSALVLWGAFDGEFLGTLAAGQAGPDGRPVPSAAGAFAGETGAMGKDVNQMQMQIDSQTGLDGSLQNRPFVQRAPLDNGEEVEYGDPDIGAQVFKGLAGAAKLAKRLGKKIRQNFTEAPNAEPGGTYEQGFGGGGRGKVVALVPGLDQSMYVAYKKGVLEKYTEWGRLLWSRDLGLGTQLYSVALVGSFLWLGCGDGTIHTASAASGDRIWSWKAHDFPVVALAHDTGSTGRGSGLVYSLSDIGSVRAWPAVPPSEQHRLAWRDGLLPCLRPHRLVVLATTWNVNETRPMPQSLRRVLEPAASADIVSIALQEVEVGTSSVARDAAFNLLSKGMLERGTHNAQWWAGELATALAHTRRSWVRVALRQMSGLVVVVFCRTELQQHVGEVATANVACGVMGVGGNKGAVAVSMSVFRRRLMFVSSHFAAHQERVDERNDNYNKIVRALHFDNTSKAAQRQGQAASDPAAREVAGLDGGFDADPETAATASLAETEDDGHGPGLADAAMLVWAGDFNYRIRGTYAEVCALACAGELSKLFAMDQCRGEMEKGTIFRGLREPLLLGYPGFVPTYKYDKGVPHGTLPGSDPGGRVKLALPFDSSEKQRVPAWTDRVFYRGSRAGSLDVADEEVIVSIARPADYNCVLEVNDSDHKPVYALLQVQLPAYEQEQKRRHSLAAATTVHHTALSGGGSVRQVVEASCSALDIRPFGAASIDLRNSSRGSFIVQVIAERRPEGVPGGAAALSPLPSWLEVSPTMFALTSRDGTSSSTGDTSQGCARVLLRALGGDASRKIESVQLRFILHPLWGSDSFGGVIGPTVAVTIRH